MNKEENKSINKYSVENRIKEIHKTIKNNTQYTVNNNSKSYNTSSTYNSLWKIAYEKCMKIDLSTYKYILGTNPNSWKLQNIYRTTK